MHWSSPNCSRARARPGVGVGYALANSVFGGTAPLIYQALKERDQVPMFIAYVTACIAVSLIVYVFSSRTRPIPTSTASRDLHSTGTHSCSVWVTPFAERAITAKMAPWVPWMDHEPGAGLTPNLG